MTLNALAQEFRKNYMIKRLRETTISGYDVNLQKHILPIVGAISLEDLHISYLDQITDELQDKGLSNKSIVYCHAVTRKMLNYAVKRGYLDVNPYAITFLRFFIASLVFMPFWITKVIKQKMKIMIYKYKLGIFLLKVC